MHPEVTVTPGTNNKLTKTLVKKSCRLHRGSEKDWHVPRSLEATFMRRAVFMPKTRTGPEHRSLSTASKAEARLLT